MIAYILTFIAIMLVVILYFIIRLTLVLEREFKIDDKYIDKDTDKFMPYADIYTDYLLRSKK